MGGRQCAQRICIYFYPAGKLGGRVSDQTSQKPVKNGSKVVKEIFRNYDIRGVYGKTLSDEDAYLVGRAFGLRLVRMGAKNCAVGYDNRLSSQALYAEYRDGLLSTGIDVIELGECLTPLVKFYVYEKKLDAGTSLTASHNAAEYNGFKLMLRDAKPFFGDEILSLYDDIVSGVKVDDSSKPGKLILGHDLLDLYAKFLAERFDFTGKGFKVALNCGNGTASTFAPKILRDLGVEVVEVNCTSDGSFPNGAPDPESHDFMQALEEKVVAENCHLGFGLDGDSDRFGLVDETGSHYASDKLMMLLASYLLPKHPGGLICCDIKSSSSLIKLITELGGKGQIIKTGYPYHIPQAQGEALFSAELSGHFFFGRKLGFYGLDDGIISACMLLKVYDELSDNVGISQSRTFSRIMADFPKLYHTAEVKINCEDAIKMSAIEKIVSKAKTDSRIKEVLTIDGVRGATSDTGWFILRASNTSPYIVGRVEGETWQEVDQIKQLVSELLETGGLSGEVLTSAPVYHS